MLHVTPTATLAGLIAFLAGLAGLVPTPPFRRLRRLWTILLVGGWAAFLALLVFYRGGA